MLTRSNRAQFATLLDALNVHYKTQTAIIYLQTDCPPIHVTHEKFRQQVIGYGAALQRLGVKPRDLVVIAHTQNLESIYAFWGAMLMGAIPSMFPTLTEKLDTEIYMQSMAKLVELSGVRAVLTTDEFAPTLSDHVRCEVYASADIRSTENASFEPYSPHEDEIALLQHSSGTTGLQKGVALAHRAILNQIASYSEAIALTEQDVIVSWLPLYHDMGLIAGFLLPLLQGVPLVLMSPFDWVAHPAMLFRAIHDYGGTLCWLPNFAYNHCARRIRQRDIEGLSAASMRMVINCSEPVHYESHKMFTERFASLGVTMDMLAVSYAMAENTFAVTQTSPSVEARIDVIDREALEKQQIATRVDIDYAQNITKVSCGKPIAGTEVCVLDKDGTALPERSIGELAVRSDCMLDGYHQRPDINPFYGGWYRTGDKGYMADGEVYIIGRSKDLIINAGKNIYPQDIEAIVNSVPGVHAGRAVAFGVPDEREGTELVGVVAEIDAHADRQTITQAIRQTVARQSMVTVTFVYLVDAGWLIKTSSGKIARAANRDKWMAERQK